MSLQLVEGFKQLVFLCVFSNRDDVFLRLEFRLFLLEGEKKELCQFFFVCKIGLRMAIFYVANGSVHSNVLCFIERERGGAPTMH